jgi:hypothetical protein
MALFRCQTLGWSLFEEGGGHVEGRVINWTINC